MLCSVVWGSRIFQDYGIFSKLYFKIALRHSVPALLDLMLKSIELMHAHGSDNWRQCYSVVETDCARSCLRWCVSFHIRTNMDASFLEWLASRKLQVPASICIFKCAFFMHTDEDVARNSRGDCWLLSWFEISVGGWCRFPCCTGCNKKVCGPSHPLGTAKKGQVIVGMKMHGTKQISFLHSFVWKHGRYLLSSCEGWGRRRLLTCV